MMTTPRDALNRLKWTEGESIEDATVYYVHRGAPGDSKAITGDCILSMGAFCFELATGACIPYHRVYRIDYRGTTIFERDAAKGR